MGNINFRLGNLPERERIYLVIADNGRGINFKHDDVTRFRNLTIWKWHPSLFDLPDDD